MIPNVWTTPNRCESGACVEVKWRTPCEAGDCVDVAQAGDAWLVRDSKDPDGPVLCFNADEWRAFVQDVKVGKFDA